MPPLYQKGEAIDGFKVKRKIGEGQFSEVYAVESESGKQVGAGCGTK